MTRVETETENQLPDWVRRATHQPAEASPKTGVIRLTTAQLRGDATRIPPAFSAPLRFDGASPSVRFVYACLRLNGASSTGGLVACSGLPSRTVRYAVDWLVGNGLARRVTKIDDARKSIIALTEPETTPPLIQIGSLAAPIAC
jgi:hypothetical protein